MSGDDQPIDDKYGNLETIDRNDAMRKGEEDKRSVETIKREDFLTIVKNDNSSAMQADDANEPNIARDGVKFKQDDEFKLKTSVNDNVTKKPLITEISSADNEKVK